MHMISTKTLKGALIGVFAVGVSFMALSGVKLPEFRADEEGGASQVLILGPDGRGATGKFTVCRKMNANVFGQMDAPEQKFVDNAASATLVVEGETLTVVFTCPVPAGMEAQKRDSPWNGDRVEFYVHPQVGGKEERFFAANCGGSCDLGHSSHAKVSADNRPDGFTVTMTIPVRDAFGKVPEPGDAFGINFLRKGRTCGNFSSWAPDGGAFNTSERRYGTLVFGGSGPYFRKRFSAFRPRCRALVAADKEVEQIVVKACDPVKRAIDAHGDDIGAFAALERMLAELDQALVAIALRRTPVIVYDNIDVWGDDLLPTGDSKMIGELVLKAPRNTRRVKAFAIANLSDGDYLGNLKVMDDPKCLYRSARADGIQGRFTLRRSVWMRRMNGSACADPLVEMPLGSLVELGSGKAQAFYLELDTKGMRPGEYGATLGLVTATSGVPSIKIPLKVVITDDDLSTVDIIHMGYTHAHKMFRNGRKPTPNVVKTYVSRGYNTVILSRFDGLYPYQDKNGVWQTPDYSDIDRYLDAWIEAGLARERMRVMPFVGPERDKGPENHLWRGLRGPDGKRLPFGSPEYDVGARKLVTDFMTHMKERYGLRKDQVIWYPVDESWGEIDDPALKSPISRATHYAKLIKGLDREYFTFYNLLADLSNTKAFHDHAAELSDCFDFIMLYGPLVSKATLKAVMDAPYRGRWTYHISTYESPARNYRCATWKNLRDGFEPESTYWHLDEGAEFAGGPYGYGTCYIDYDYDCLALSRRQLANDMSFEEGKLVKYLRLKFADDASKKAIVEAIVTEAANHPTMQGLDVALEKLINLL